MDREKGFVYYKKYCWKKRLCLFSANICL